MCASVSTHAIQIAPMYLKLCNVYDSPTPSQSWIGQIEGRYYHWLHPERFLVSIFPVSEKFDSDLELDAGMHKTECTARDMMVNVGTPFNFHHKRILNLAVVSQFIGNANLIAAMISFFQINNIVCLIHTKLKLNMSVQVANNYDLNSILMNIF